jgi:hypothetical protein
MWAVVFFLPAREYVSCLSERVLEKRERGKKAECSGTLKGK